MGTTINSAYDKMFDNSDGFPFVVGGSVMNVTSQHPSAIQIFQLWQVSIQSLSLPSVIPISLVQSS